MMKYLILLFIMVFSTQVMQCQDKTKFSKKSRGLSFELLTKAEENKLGDPSQSIGYLDQLINLAKENNDLSILVKAYQLLAEINRNTGLKELAIKRFDQALIYAKQLNNDDVLGSLFYEKGRVENDLRLPSAIKTFRSCLELQSKDDFSTKCYEGLGLAYFNNDQMDEASAIFKELEVNHYTNTPIELSRAQAYQSQIDIKNNDPQSAKLNYNNARSNFKRGKGGASDYTILDSTYIQYSSQSNNIDDEIKILKENIDYTMDIPESQMKEEVGLADAYIRKGDLVNASNTILKVKSKVVKTEDVKLKADVYKKSSEILAKKGQYAQALEDYKYFESQQAKLISEKEKELQMKIDLLVDQNAIDISENVYSSNLKLDRSEAKVDNFQQYIIYLLCSLLAMALFGAWWISRSLKAQHIANKQLELKSLRGQMNPHFIFNALNSVNEFIATQNPRKANAYLSQFSNLMRSVLDVNMKDLIPLSEELALTRNYLELEYARFSDKFDYNYEVNAEIEQSDHEVPPMLLQPYLENAIWHGLRYLDYKGELNIKANQTNKFIEIVISDNGIGRTQSALSKTKHQKAHKSTGLKNTSDRIQIIQSLYEKRVEVEVSDLVNNETNSGTKVSIKIFT